MLRITLIRSVVVTFTALLIASTVAAQSAVMPLPVAVVKDADGKTVAQVVAMDETWVRALVDFGNGPVSFYVFPQGLVAEGGGDVHFTGSGCTGDAYIAKLSNPTGNSYTKAFQVDRVEVVGPDPALGTYRVFRATTDVEESYAGLSILDVLQNTCINGPTSGTRLPADEVIPSPMAGFHGPTIAEPDRTWTIQGGTTIIPLSPTPAPTPTPPAP